MKKQKIVRKFPKIIDINHIVARWGKIHTIAIFFIIFLLFIIQKLFSYTVLNFDFYTQLADSQQIGKVIVPVNRGTIYSGGKRETVFGTSLNLYDVAIDPQMPGDIKKLGEFLVEIIHTELCLNKSKNKCETNLTKFLKVLEIENFVRDEEVIKEMIRDKIITKLVQTKVTSVFIDKELDSEQIDKINQLGLTGLYPRNNYLYINPQEFIDTSENIKNLSKIVGTNQERLKYLSRKRDLRYIPILNKLSISTSEYIKDYIKGELEAIEKGILDKVNSIGGFFVLTPNPNRYYPENEVASQVIGFVDNEGTGHYGIEGNFNNILKGNNGQIVSTKDIRGRILDPISLKSENLVGEGVEIITTIDRNIQRKVEQILENGVNKYRANKGTVVIMEPQTGNIIAMANYPTYDLNNFGDVYELEKVRYSKYPDPKIDLLGIPVFIEDNEFGEKLYYDNKEIFLRKANREELGNIALVKYKYKNDFGSHVYLNDAISSLYEPGSIMKAITMAIGIDTGEITKNSMYMDKGFVEIDRFKIENVSDKCLGYHSFGHALNYSCNVGMIRIVQRVGKVLLNQYFEEFGFGQITGIDLQGEVYTKIEPWEKRPKSKLLINSFGLGISVTPLHMAGAYNVIANKGIYVKPKIIDKIIYPDGKIATYKTEKQRRVIKETTSEIVTEMLLDSVENGVANTGKVEGYSLAGKTGTSEIPYKGVYERGAGFTMASYAGFGPIEDPKFTIIVKLERPRTNQYGGQTAAFIFKDIASYLFDYYEIPKKK